MIFRLTTTYREKEEAKKYGARWNARGKYWYYQGDSLPDELKKWYPQGKKTSGRRAAETPVPDVMPNGFELSGDRTPFDIGVSFDDEFSSDTGIPFDDIPPFDDIGRLFDVPLDGQTDFEEPFSGRTELSSPFSTGALDASVSEAPSYMTVSQVSELIIDCFDRNLAFHNVMVKGEVTNYSGVRSGNNYYFDIKDEVTLLKCIMWSGVAEKYLTFEFKKGVEVNLIGDVTYYAPAGKLSFRVKKIYEAGEGPAFRAYLKLKQKLSDEGLFDIEHKKPINKHPRTVGLIMSRNGEVLKDIRQYAEEKNPYVQLVLYHVNVQGRNAVATITKAIQFMDAQGFDDLIIGRGGGSDEELKAYDAEPVVRAAFAARTPIISAVGHQGHAPLLDLVADIRVSTPTKAAEQCIPDVMQDIKKVKDLERVMKNYMTVQWNRRLDRLKIMEAQLEKNSPAVKLREQQDRLKVLQAQLAQNSPEIRIRERQEKLTKIREFLQINMQNLFESRKHRMEMLIATLNGLSPTAKLVKGFGYISANGKPLTSVENVKTGEEIDVTIHDGSVHAIVDRVTRKAADQE